MPEVRRRAESGAAEVRHVEVKVGEQQPIREPHPTKIEILILEFSLEGLFEIRTFLFAGKVKHAVPLAFMFSIERLSLARGTHPRFAVANKSRFRFRHR